MEPFWFFRRGGAYDFAYDSRLTESLQRSYDSVPNEDQPWSSAGQSNLQGRGLKTFGGKSNDSW